jgi:putative membrane protein
MDPLLSAEDRRRIETAVEEAERRTAAEIVCVIAHQSSDYAYVPVVWAALAALAAPLLIGALAPWSSETVHLLQLAIFALVLAALWWPPARLAVTPRPLFRKLGHQRAVEQFLGRGLTATRGRTGLLIFVSVAEHYAEIIADTGVEAEVPADAWRAPVEVLTDALARRQPADGFVAALRLSADLLERHVPRRPGDLDELPNRVVEI